MGLSENIRRVVTAVDDSGKAVVLFDGDDRHAARRGRNPSQGRRVKAGDVVVQQATNHAFVNRGKKPCRVAFVLIDATEP